MLSAPIVASQPLAACNLLHRDDATTGKKGAGRARQAMAQKETGPEKPDRFFSQIGRRP